MGKGSSDTKKGLLELDDPGALHEGGEGAASGPSDVQRPTVIPKFDPSQFAEQSEVRARMPTLTDEAALEMARLQSMPTNIPPPRKEPSTAPGPPGPPGPLEPTPWETPVVSYEDELDVFGVDEQAAVLTGRLAPLSRVPTLAREMTQLGALLEDPKTAFVLGFVDGILPLETIVDVTGLPELETLRVLDRMVTQGVIVFRPPAR